ncbi:MAG: hypothetical protein QXK63_05180, partial [Thermoproteus sp.]
GTSVASIGAVGPRLAGAYREASNEENSLPSFRRACADLWPFFDRRRIRFVLKNINNVNILMWKTEFGP